MKSFFVSKKEDKDSWIKKFLADNPGYIISEEKDIGDKFEIIAKEGLPEESNKSEKDLIDALRGILSKSINPVKGTIDDRISNAEEKITNNEKIRLKDAESFNKKTSDLLAKIDAIDAKFNALVQYLSAIPTKK